MERRRRRSRFRTTAEPTRRVTAKARRMRGAPSGVSATCTSVSDPRRTCVPWWRSAAKVRRSRIGPIRLTAWPGPSGDGCARWRARPVWTCGSGSRGSWPACGRWVGTFSSRRRSSSGPGGGARRGARRGTGCGVSLARGTQARNVRQRYALAVRRGNKGAGHRSRHPRERVGTRPPTALHAAAPAVLRSALQPGPTRRTCSSPDLDGAAPHGRRPGSLFHTCG